VLFYTFSALAVLGGALLVTQRNPAHAALSFALVILNTCGLFLLLAAPFLMAATVIIYAGAIVVTFLFVIMLAQQPGLSDADARSREPLLATLTGFLLLAALLYVVQLGYDTREVDQLIARAHDAAEQKDREAMERVVGKSEEKDYLFKNYKDFMAAQAWPDLREAVETLDTETLLYTTPSPEGYRATLLKLEALGRQARTRLGTLQPPADLPLSGLSGPPASTPPSELRRDGVTGRPQLPAENSAYLGRSLFTDFLLPVELGGMLLLVAALGAIAIAHRRTPHAGPEADGGPERRA
jgi:NADH:ubiquinone oxidoreductase subunit 6 (subunit J)